MKLYFMKSQYYQIIEFTAALSQLKFGALKKLIRKFKKKKFPTNLKLADATIDF